MRVTEVCSGCELCVKQGSTRLLEGVSAAACDCIERARQTRNYARGTLLFRQGAQATGVFCVRSGLIKIYHTDAGGKRQILRLAGPGDFLGFRSLLFQREATNTAEVVTATTVCQIEGEAVWRAIEADPGVTQNIMRTMGLALDAVEARLFSQVHLSTPARVVRFILDCSVGDKNGEVAPLTREEMAQLNGTTMESVCRLIRLLARKGLLHLRGSTITVADRDALKAFSARAFEGGQVG